MKEYQLEIRRENGYFVKICEKQHGLWICFGTFKIIDEELFLEDKHNYWKKASNLTDAETFFALSIERFQYFFKVAKKYLSVISAKNPPLFYVFSKNKAQKLGRNMRPSFYSCISSFLK